MNAPVALYNFAPALHIMLLGLSVACGPLAWVWLRQSRRSPAQRMAALTVLTLFLTFDLVMFGAFTRLTDSGLGCPDWPGCYGTASPVGAQAQISAAQAALPSGPVTHAKAWIEMTHRYLATAVGVLILTIAVASVARRRELPVGPAWPLASLAWVCLQGAFGAFTVTLKLKPAIVTAHLLAALVLLVLLCRQAVAYSQAHAGRARVPLPPGLRWALGAGFALLWLQVALGGWVSTNYAVLACSSFPLCQGSWWPAMDFGPAFQLWRDLGLTADGQSITFAALTAIHYTHRLVAYVLVPVLLGLGWALRRHGLPRQGAWLLGLVLLQLATGLGNVLLGWPLAAAVAHTGGAAALVTVLTWAWCESRSAQRVAPRAAGRAAEGAQA